MINSHPHHRQLSLHKQPRKAKSWRSDASIILPGWEHHTGGSRLTPTVHPCPLRRGRLRVARHSSTAPNKMSPKLFSLPFSLSLFPIPFLFSPLFFLCFLFFQHSSTPTCGKRSHKVWRSHATEAEIAAGLISPLCSNQVGRDKPVAHPKRDQNRPHGRPRPLSAVQSLTLPKTCIS